VRVTHVSFVVTLLLTLVHPLAAQRSDTAVRNVGAPLHAGVARLVAELSIGKADGADEYVFGRIPYRIAWP
jgi:hypothetical protein